MTTDKRRHIVRHRDRERKRDNCQRGCVRGCNCSGGPEDGSELRLRCGGRGEASRDGEPEDMGSLENRRSQDNTAAPKVGRHWTVGQAIVTGPQHVDMTHGCTSLQTPAVMLTRVQLRLLEDVHLR
jgi:hypothetical protein